MASKRYKHGRYSKALPMRLNEQYQAALNDDEYLALRQEIALTEARLADVLQGVDTGESGRLWKELQGHVNQFMKASRADDTESMQEILPRIVEGVRRGSHDSAAWSEIGGLLEQRRRLVESERKRLESMQQMVTSEQAMVLVQVLVTSVRNHILEYMGSDSDRTWKLLAAIQADVVRTIGRGNRPTANLSG